MFNRAHSVFLRQLICHMCGEQELSGRELREDLDLFYLNILPDALPFHANLNPLITHAPEVLPALENRDTAAGEKLFLGFRLHHLLDNLSHCGSLKQTGDYTRGFALQSGMKIKGRARPELGEIFSRVEGKSALYVLHSGVEMAVELCVTEPGINSVLDEAAQVFFSREEEYRLRISALPGLTPESLELALAGMKERARTLPFSDGVSLEGLTRRFVSRYLPSSDTPEMNEMVREFLRLAQQFMAELWPPFLHSSVQNVLDHDPAIKTTLTRLIAQRD